MNKKYILNGDQMERKIAKAYIFFLSLRMISPFTFLKFIVHASATDFDFILNMLGIILILRRNHWKIPFSNTSESFLLRSFATMVLFFNCSSLIMAIVMHLTYGSIGNDTAFSAVSGMMIYWLQYIFIFYYNKEIFSTLPKKEIEKIIQLEIWCLLILGYFQFACQNIGGIFCTLYDGIDIFDVLVDSSRLGKLALTGSEGASASSIIGVFIFPFLLSGILNKQSSRSEIVQIILWLPIIYATNSSSAYICVVSSIPCFLWLLLKRGSIKKTDVIVASVIGVIALIIFLLRDYFVNMIPSEIGDQIRYLLIEKGSDRRNGSTVTRTIPLITNWGAFTEYPILGVGNGCQGFFYHKYFPSWAMNVPGSDVMVFYNAALSQITNGALFFPSILSGYGIVGVFLFLRYIWKSYKVMRSKHLMIGRFENYYYIALLPLALCGFQGEFAVKYLIWFIISLPYMKADTHERTQ